MNELFTHEDDYCQIELLPISNEAFCRGQTGEIDAFAEQHRDGVGYIDMFVREENPFPLSTLGISKPELKGAIGVTAKYFDSVFTGYGNYREPRNNTVAFSTTENVALFVELNETQVVANAWLTLHTFTESDVNSAATLIAKLAQWELLLVDWGWSRCIQISEEDVMKLYLRIARKISV